MLKNSPRLLLSSTPEAQRAWRRFLFSTLARGDGLSSGFVVQVMCRGFICGCMVVGDGLDMFGSFLFLVIDGEVSDLFFEAHLCLVFKGMSFFFCCGEREG